MLTGVERLVDLAGMRNSPGSVETAQHIQNAVLEADINSLAKAEGHFATVARNGQTVRLARTIGYPLRYFVAKMFHGPILVVSDRIDTIFDWCQSQKIGWQFDPLYTRMVPAHYLVEIDQIGCPDPAPRYHRFFNPAIGSGTTDLVAAGTDYISAAYLSLKNWLSSIPADEPAALAFSGGIDSTAILLLARQALLELDRSPELIKAFTLDMGGGKDAEQAKTVINSLGLAANWEVIRAAPESLDLAEAIQVIEDYHPLDVECAAAAMCLLKGIRQRYPSIKYLLDGDGGDENLKSYPLEDSDLTLSSVLRNPMLYQEGWGVENMKHSLTYSGGLSRAYVRTYAPGQHYGFDAFSPFTDRNAIAAALSIPYETVLGGDVEKLYLLKQTVVQAGVKSVTGIEMPINPKRRFQVGAGGDDYQRWRVSKAWCRQIFLKQWENRLKVAWDPTGDRISGNEAPTLSR